MLIKNYKRLDMENYLGKKKINFTKNITKKE